MQLHGPRPSPPASRLAVRALLAAALACTVSVAQPTLSSAQGKPGAVETVPVQAQHVVSAERPGPAGGKGRGKRGGRRNASRGTKAPAKAAATPPPSNPSPAPAPASVAPPAIPPIAQNPPVPQDPPPVATPTPPSPPVSTSPSDPLIDAGFENGFAGWSMAGVGDVQPTIATDVARSGAQSARVSVTGSQNRSEMILADRNSNILNFTEGDERYYSFSFMVRSMRYGGPGAHNLITQLKSDGEGSPAWGLQLWDFEGKRGLWSHGAAAGGDRFLAPIPHDQWNDVVIHFKASRTGQGFYETFLNGQLVDSRQGVSMIRPDRTSAYLKTGIYRNGGQIPGTSELRYDAVRLAQSASQVAPTA